METMEMRLTEAKRKAQEEAVEMIDRHFKKYEAAGKSKILTIDMVEDFMGEAMEEGARIIKEAADAAINAMENDLVEKKKYAPIATEK